MQIKLQLTVKTALNKQIEQKFNFSNFSENNRKKIRFFSTKFIFLEKYVPYGYVGKFISGRECRVHTTQTQGPRGAGNCATNKANECKGRLAAVPCGV